MSHYKPYPAYKDSGVEWLGQVPAHWEVRRLCYAATLNPPIKAGLPLNDEVSFLPMESIGTDGSICLDKTRPVFEVRSGYSYFEDGDVAFAKVTPCFENGKGAVMNDLIGGIGFGTTELTVLRANAGTDAKFINYLLQCDRFRLFGAGAMTGAGGLKRVPDEFTRNFTASWPVLVEQRMICDHLDRETARIDGLVSRKARFIELLREKRQALITHAVTKGLDPNVPMKDSGVEWLGDMPAHWSAKCVKYVARLESGHTPSMKIAEYWVDCDIPWVSLGDSSQLREIDYIYETAKYLNKKGLQGSSAHILPIGTVVFTRDATVGLAAITGREMAVSQHLIGWVPSDKIKSEYLLRVFNVMESWLNSLTTGATIKTIGMDDIRTLMTPVPPMDEQDRIVEYVLMWMTKFDGLITTTKSSIELLKERRSALITAAVTGQIDLREAA
jgi:type I restriction enzyme S subunit